MIIRSFIFQVYSVIVHGPDVMMPEAEPFCTIYKYGKFHPATRWNNKEKRIATWAIKQALANPRKTTEITEQIIMENPQ